VVAIVMGALSSCGISATSGWNASVPGRELQKPTTVDSPYGPLYVLVAVAQAGLWEAPTSELVARESKNPRVKDVAAQPAREHHALNKVNEEAAMRLNVRSEFGPPERRRGAGHAAGRPEPGHGRRRQDRGRQPNTTVSPCPARDSRSRWRPVPAGSPRISCPKRPQLGEQVADLR
jgi:hypothetical protein